MCFLLIFLCIHSKVKSQSNPPPIPIEFISGCSVDGLDLENYDPTYRDNEVCQTLGLALTEYLPHIPYIPTSNDPVLTINVNLIFIARNDGTGSFVDIPEHIAIWNEIESNLNDRYGTLIEPAYTGSNSTCFDPFAPFVSNPKIQFNLNPVFLNSDIYNDMTEIGATAIGSAMQPFLDANAPQLSCYNAINVVMPTDYANLQDVINNGAAETSNQNYNATLPYFNNLSKTSYAHLPNLYIKYVWMKTVIPETTQYPYPWNPVIRNWFINSVSNGLAHELGHTLGLHHYNAVHSTNACEYSIMNQSGSGIHNFLPPTEVGKIHRALAHSNIRNAVDISSYSLNPIVVNVNTTWDTNRKLYRPVVVQSGATLTVTCRLLFHPDATIIVKQGGTLIVDGGTLTNYCGQMWKGIQVWGDSDKDQYPYSVSNYYQGRAIFINDALLENAREGIQNWNPGHFDQIGGIIQAKNSTFRNCRRVAAFMTYQNTSPTNQQVKRPDQSYFQLCKFENNDDYLADQNVNPPYAMVTLWETDRVRFSGCEFLNTATVNHSQALSRAIYSSDANYVVNSYCNDPISNVNGCQGIETYSEFTGWYKAIQADGALTSNRPISVSKSIFKENMIGIEIAGAEYSEIYKNEFELGDHPFATSYNLETWQSHLGVFSNSTLNFAIEENDFERLASAPHDGYGVLAYNSKGSENVLYKNDFKNLKVGANGWQVNKNINFEGGVPAGQSGLQFLCNDNEDNEVDFEVSRSGTNQEPDFVNAGIRQNQGSGSPQKPAGNTFSNPTADPSIYTHFTVSSVDIYGYFYRNNPPSYSEITPGKVSIQPQLTVNNSCPTNYPTGPKIIKEKSQLIGKISEFNALRYTYSQVIDDGNTQGMVSEIELAWPDDAWDLRDALIARSPYNSEEVLIAAALKEIMPHAMLLEVLLENP